MINHIAFIMDGNRRYSKTQGLDLTKGYKIGMDQVINFIKYQIKNNIKETTYYAFSNENLKGRSDREKEILFDLITNFTEKPEIENFFVENNIFLEIKGNLEEMKKHKKYAITKLEELKNRINQRVGEIKFKVNFAINYGGQNEILHAVKEIVNKVNEGILDPNQITTKTIKDNIYFNNSPEPEIIVRPGNAPRLSGFMLWDSQYSEIYLTKKFWPELTEKDYNEIIIWYRGLKRNFGK